MIFDFQGLEMFEVKCVEAGLLGGLHDVSPSTHAE